MSEHKMQPIDPIKSTMGAVVQISAGAMLRTARETQGLHIATLAVTLKVPVKKLEALEADQYDVFPDNVFVRALASGVCRVLKIDATPILDALPRSHTPKIKTDESGLNTTFNDASSNSNKVLLSQLNRPLGIAVMLVFAGILAIVFFPKSTSFKAEPVTGPNRTLQVVPDVRVSPVEANVNPQPPVVAASNVSETVILPPVEAVGQPKTLAMNSFSSVHPDSEIASNIAAVLALHAHGTSWVEVVDARGTLQLRQTLNKGDVVPVSGTLPLTVVLGRADLITAVVRGKPIDTTAVTNNNVARFEVK